MGLLMKDIASLSGINVANLVCRPPSISVSAEISELQELIKTPNMPPEFYQRLEESLVLLLLEHEKILNKTAHAYVRDYAKRADSNHELVSVCVCSYFV
jgi:hypothetical protein